MKLLLPLLFALTSITAFSQQVKITQGPKVEHVGADSAVIAWSTDGSSSTLIRYGFDANNLSGQANGQDSAGTHRVTLTGLHPATPYYFSVESSGTRSEVRSFTTTPPADTANQDQNDARILVGPVPQRVTDTSAALWWMGLSKAHIAYGVNKSQMNSKATEDLRDPGKQHHAVLAPLQPDTTYYYAMLDATGKPSISGQFTTEAQGFKSGGRVWVTAGPVLEFLDNSSAVVAWSTNVNASTMVRFSQDPTNLNQNAQAPWGLETHRVTLKNLKPDSVYYFLIESGQGQGSGTMAKGNVGRFRTLKHNEMPLRNLAAQSR